MCMPLQDDRMELQSLALAKPHVLHRLKMHCYGRGKSKVIEVGRLKNIQEEQTL